MHGTNNTNADNKKKYPGQPDNEIWFYDRDMPYYWLTNFYTSPIKSKLPLKIEKGDHFYSEYGKENILWEKGKIPNKYEYFYNEEFRSWEENKNDKHWNKRDIILSKIGQGKEFVWPTAEHLFQALKFTDWHLIPEYVGGYYAPPYNQWAKTNLLAEKIEEIARETSPRQAREKGKNGIFFRGLSGEGIRNDWHKKINGDKLTTPMKVRAMRFAVREKFTQNSKLREKLWKTGNKKLVEHTTNDGFWGDKGDGSGENKLGKILMEIRKEIVAEKGREYIPPKTEPEKPETTSPETEKPQSEPDATEPEGTDNNSADNEENNKPNPNNPDNSNQNQDNKIRQKRDEVINNINTALNQDPQIIDSELSNDYQNWREKLKTIADLTKIETFAKEVKANIENERKIKLAAEKVKNEVKNAQNKTGEELRQDLKNLKKGESNKSHQGQQEEIEKLSKRSAQEDSENYRKMAVDLIKENLKENQIEENEIEKLPEIKDDWKKMKNGEINQPEEIVNTEKKINKKVHEVGAQKRIDKVIENAHQALKLGTKEELKKAIEEMIKFISSSNIYDQAIYSQKKETLNQLKSALENYSTNRPSSGSPSKSPWKIIIPVSLSVILVGGVMIVIVKIINIRKRRQKKKS